jgi:hypothetical protein
VCRVSRRTHHDGNPGCVQDCKDDIGPPFDVFEGRRSNVNDQEVHDPVCACGDGRTSLSETERKNLGGVHPYRGLEADGECTLEDEKHRCRSDASAI